MRTRLVALVFAVVCCLVAKTAQAQSDVAAAALFDRGLEDMQAGNYEKGCPALAESNHLDPRAGVLFTLAECEAKWGKIASALLRYEQFLKRYGRRRDLKTQKQRERAKIARRERDALSKRVPKLTIALADGVPQGARVRRDGEIVGEPVLGLALPCDPGEHIVLLEIPGRPPEEHTLMLEPGEDKKLVLGKSEPKAPPPAPAVDETVEPSGGEWMAPNPEFAETPQRERGLRKWAYVAGGVGAAGLLVGAATGIVVLANKGTVDDHCNGNVCDQEGKDAADRAQTFGTISTIGFGVAIVGLGTGAVLYWLDPPKSGNTAKRVRGPRDASWGLRSGPGDLGIGVGGAF